MAPQHIILILAVIALSTLLVAAKPTPQNIVADDDCLTFLPNKTVSWLAVWHGYSGAGTAFYSPNGTLVTWDPQGNLVNNGTYTVKRGANGWCYEYEVYQYPPDASPTCNTFRLLPSPIPGDDVMIGCEIFGDQCYESCDTEKVWKDWYVARVVT